MLLSGREALRIAAALALPIADFTQFPFSEQERGEFRIVLYDAASQQRRYHRMELRQTPTPGESHAKRCFFLSEQDGAVRCGCYPVRPRSCIAFPYQEHAGGVRLSRFEKAWCPKDEWKKVAVDVPAHRLLRREIEADREVYRAVIDTWNADRFEETTRFAVAHFLEYLELAYQTLEAVTPPLFEGEARLMPAELLRLYDAAATALRARLH